MGGRRLDGGKEERWKEDPSDFNTSALLLCTECGSSCHQRCVKNMAPLCGVNEKLLAEALKNVDELKKSKKVIQYVP